MRMALFIVLLLSGGFLAWTTTRRMISSPPPGLRRDNYRGRTLPVVLGEGVVFGSLSGCAVLGLAMALGAETDIPPQVVAVTGLLTAVMFVAGSLDDHRGDEQDRGFKGHLSALAQGRFTGGLVKLLAGGVVGVLGAGILTDFDPEATLRGAALVALSSNLLNLLDRAPGRALKAWTLLAVPAVLLAGWAWLLPAAPLMGAAAAVTPDDLGERAMLGDAGANPLGAVAGLGMFIGASPGWGWTIAVVLLALNLASERWSFSRAIERIALLRWLDRLGRESSAPRYPGS